MAKASDNEKALWVEFAKVALQSYEIPEDIENLDEMVDDIGNVCGTIADEMLDQFMERYGETTGRAPRARGGRRTRRSEEDPERGDD